MGFRTFTGFALLGVMLTGCGGGGGSSNSSGDNSSNDAAANIIAIATPQASTGATAACQTQLQGIFDDLLTETNAVRADNGVGPLRFSRRLGEAAQGHAEDMAAGDYFAHTSPSGSTLASRIEAVGYDYSTAGENLAAGYDSAKDTVTAWFNSPGHKANLLNPNFVDVGFGLIFDDVQSANASATFDNYWVQNFGRPTDSNTDTAAAYITDNCNLGTITSTANGVLSGSITNDLATDTKVAATVSDTSSTRIEEKSAISALSIAAASDEPWPGPTFSESSLVASADIHGENQPVSTPEPAMALGLMSVGFVALRSRPKSPSRAVTPKLH